jgi:inner membrane protein
VTSERRVHVAQYILVGLSQVVFYLLLLSFSERIGFDLAFLVSASATVGLIGLYAGSVFASRKQGLIALLVFGILYGLIYVLMSLEDYALMVGSIAAFAVIAAVMYFTKGIDWYGLAQIKPDPKTTLSKTQLKETT